MVGWRGGAAPSNWLNLRAWHCGDKAEQTFRFLSERHQPNVGKQRQCGRSSVVERQLPKLYVEGSIPFARSIT
jgi:hypothetical protein